MRVVIIGAGYDGRRVLSGDKAKRLDYEGICWRILGCP